MKLILGIDTSNYTTSAALVDAQSGEVMASAKRLLPVKPGELGIRQSDAVFHHTKALPELVRDVYRGIQGETVGVAVSSKPAEQLGSYMPCFLAGVNAAAVCAQALQVPLYETSHQKGHVLACLHGADALSAVQSRFLCFHVSGGTTDALLCTPDAQQVFQTERVAKSLDLKAGQAVDRIGAKMGLAFPAGAALEELALSSNCIFSQKALLKGNDCSFSGLENLAYKMLASNESRADTAKFTLDYIANTLLQMSLNIFKEYGTMPLFFAGGVMSNSIIRQTLTQELGAKFCPPALSADNAVGVALYGYLKWNNLKN